MSLIKKNMQNESFNQLSKYQIRSLIQGKVDKELCCGICLEMALCPVECVQCQHLFCEDCIKKLKTWTLKCPNKCSSSIMKTKEPHRVLKNQYMAQKVICPNVGCGATFSLESLINHDKHCSFKKEVCGHNGCTYFDKDILNHRKICQYRQIICNDCGCRYQARDKHNCILYLKTLIDDLSQTVVKLQKKVKLLEEGDKSRESLFDSCENENKQDGVEEYEEEEDDEEDDEDEEDEDDEDDDQDSYSNES